MGSQEGAPRLNVLGVGISPVDIQGTLEAVDRWIDQRQRTYVCLAAVHSVMASRRDASLRRVINRSGLTTPDGMPLVWLCRAAGYRQTQRVYGPDLMLAACARSIDKGWRHFFFGGAVGVAQALAGSLQQRFPGLVVVGTRTPPFGNVSDEQRESFVREINAARPDIVWVGLGTSRQEHWMAEHRPRLEAPVLIGVGAAFDFLSGVKPQAPRWMQRSGLEWLFRLGSEPRRLWPRYRQYPFFLILLAAQLAGLRRYPLDGG